MTPKEKAVELRDKYYDELCVIQFDTQYRFDLAKECALIAVAELIENDLSTDYWKYVKTNLENL